MPTCSLLSTLLAACPFFSSSSFAIVIRDIYLQTAMDFICSSLSLFIPRHPLLLYGPTIMESVSGASQSHLPTMPRREPNGESWPGMDAGSALGRVGGDDEPWVEDGVVQASRPGLTLVFPVLSLQPGHGTGSWALRMPGNTTWRSQMPSSLTTLPMSARPQRLPCAPGGPN